MAPRLPDRNVISGLERRIRKVLPENRTGERLMGGVCLLILTLIFSAGLPLLILMFGYFIHPWLAFALQCYMCYAILATKSLKTESMKVSYALESEGLAAGRKAVSMIVGRDTERLDETGVVKAAVETVAENTSDGVVAPLFYMTLGGVPLMFLYKASTRWIPWWDIRMNNI